MTTIHNTRTARAARAIAVRLDRGERVTLYARTERADNVLLRIHNYLNHFCGNYCFTFFRGGTIVLVTKNGV